MNEHRCKGPASVWTVIAEQDTQQLRHAVICLLSRRTKMFDILCKLRSQSTMDSEKEMLAAKQNFLRALWHDSYPFAAEENQ